MIGLFIILIFVLFLPFSVKKVEHNLEIFLFIMGVAAALVSGDDEPPFNWKGSCRSH